MNDCERELIEAERISSECAGAVRLQNGCLSRLTCDELDAWLEESPTDGYPCKELDDYIDVVCFGK